MKTLPESQKKKMSESAKKRWAENRGAGFVKGNQCAAGSPPNETSFKKEQHPSAKTEFKKGHVPYIKLHPEVAQRGEQHHAWKGGITPENIRIRASIEYRLWRKAVFARDNWTCLGCNIKGGELHAHHIKSFSKYPELKFAIDNGATLCKPCHMETPNYGNKTQVGGT